MQYNLLLRYAVPIEDLQMSGVPPKTQPKQPRMVSWLRPNYHVLLTFDEPGQHFLREVTRLAGFVLIAPFELACERI